MKLKTVQQLIDEGYEFNDKEIQVLGITYAIALDCLETVSVYGMDYYNREWQSGRYFDRLVMDDLK